MRIVLKLGTAVLTGDNGKLDRSRINEIAKEVCASSGSGKGGSGNEFIIVTSGAVAAGMEELGLKEKLRDLSAVQAAAAVGQSILMHAYSEAFKGKKSVAQVLLTNDDFTNRQRYLNLRNTLGELLSRKVIPIINENDTVSVRELEGGFGDNDELSALVAGGIEADMLILLTDVPGVYTDNPKNKGAELIREIGKLTPEIEAACCGKSGLGRGGMLSKLKSAKLAADSGVKVVIASGKVKNALTSALSGTAGTAILASRKISEREKWIGYASGERGRITVNECAAEALLDKGASLLPVGITSVTGEFKQGDIVSIADESGEKIARGISNYSSSELKKIRGMKSAEIKSALGFCHADAIYRGNLVFVK